MSTNVHDLTHAREADGPFSHIRDGRMRAFLVAFALTGNKSEAARAAGVDRTTPYSTRWRRDQVFQAGLEEAEAISADLLEDEAIRRAVRGVRKPLHHTKTGEPLLHPDRCDCGHDRRECHPRSPEGKHGPCTAPECGCGGFVGAPVYETSYSDAVLIRLLQARRPERFTERRQLVVGNGCLAGIEYSRLPDEVIHSITVEKTHPFSALMNWVSAQQPALLAAVSEELDDDEGEILDAEIVPSSHVPAGEEAPEEEPDGGDAP